MWDKGTSFLLKRKSVFFLFFSRLGMESWLRGSAICLSGGCFCSCRYFLSCAFDGYSVPLQGYDDYEMRDKFLIWIGICISLCMTQVRTYSQIVLSPDAHTSLLTCSPGTEAYSKFGHTAIRIVDPTQDIDIVFNYGVFSFETEDFYLRFIKGETDYQLGLESMHWFVVGNASIGRETYEQFLNLSTTQQQMLLEKLIVNYQIENRFYRYNFVFDNCATRPYRLLSEVVEMADTDSALTKKTGRTYRQLISYYAGKYSWLSYGINLIFGQDADEEMTLEESFFLPEQLMNYVATATMTHDMPLCVSDNTKPFVVERHLWCVSPECVTLLVCLLILAMTFFDLSRKKISWWLDAVLFFMYGMLGIICCFLTFFSLHPLVGHNWNILFLSPLFFIPFILILFPARRKCLLRGHLYVGIYFYIALLVRLCVGQTWHPFLFIPIAQFVHIRFVWYRNVFILGKGGNVHTAVKTGLLTVLLTAGAMCSPLSANSRLTVVVAVEGLNSVCINEMRPFLPQGGLRTLDEEALELPVCFSHNLYGGCESVATLLTGANPSEHGIAAERYYSRTDRKPHTVLEDDEVTGIGTSLSISPKAILAPTLSDNFRMLNPSGQSKIYAVGIHANNTILMAGHAANACAWINGEEQRWVTTAFYSDGLPEEADRMNVGGRFAEITARQWVPRMDIQSYLHPTSTEIKQQKFQYSMPEDLTTSPAANDLVVELALAIQQEKQLGKDVAPDLLLLEMTVIAPQQNSDVLSSAAQEDMYLSLNQNLGFLMEQLNKRVGREHYEIVVVGFPRYGVGISSYQRANMGVRQFNVDRAAALCNTYLMAMYGHERWVDGGYLNSIYLNRTLIEQRQMSVSALQQQISDFLLEFEGVQLAFPSNRIPYLQESGSVANLRNSYNKRCYGDVLFTLQPLWTLESQIFAPISTGTVCFFWTKSSQITSKEQIDATKVKSIILSIL